MLIDSADLIRKLPMMIQGNKTFAKFSEGGDYHIGEVDSWCLNYKEIVEGIESYCEYKRTNQYKLGAPVNGSFALDSYDYDEPQTDYDKGLQQFADILFDKEKCEQFLEDCKAMGIEPQTERSEE